VDGWKEEEICKKIVYSLFELQVVCGGESQCGIDATTREIELLAFDDEQHHHNLTHKFLALTCKLSPTSLLVYSIDSYQEVKF
jgi:hypothetical protein